MRSAVALGALLSLLGARAHAQELEPLAPWPEPPPPPPPPASPPPPEPPLILPPKEIDGERPDPWRLILGGQIHADLASLPFAAVGIGAGLGVRVARLRLDAEVAFWFPQDVTIDGTLAGADFTLFTGALSGCPLILREPIELGPCVGIELGRQTVTSFGVLEPGETSFLWSAFLGDVQATWVFAAPFAARAGLGVAVPFRRPQWSLDPEGALDRAGVVTARAQLGIELHL